MTKSKVQYCCDAVAHVVQSNKRSSLFVAPYNQMDEASRRVFQAAYTHVAEGGLQSPEALLRFIYSQYSSTKSNLSIPEEKHQYVDVYLFFYAAKAIAHFSQRTLETDPWKCGVYGVELYARNNDIPNFISEKDCQNEEMQEYFQEAQGMSMLPYELLNLYTAALYTFTNKPLNGLLTTKEKSELYDITGLILACFIQ